MKINPLVLRALATAAVAFAILLPIQMIRGKVEERHVRADDVVATFASETSGAQVITGPFLAVTCEETYPEERQILRAGKAETIRETKTGPCPTAYFAPRTFRAGAELPVETLHRGLYLIQHYRAKAHWDGELAWPGPPESTATHKRAWKHVYMVTHVRDRRGVKAIASATSAALLAGVGEPGLDAFAIREDLGAYESKQPGTPIPFSYDAVIAGLGSFQVAPVGDKSEIRLASNWPHPSFSQGWSPDERRIDASGFAATWRLDSVATGGNASWMQLAQQGKLSGTAGAGVGFHEPVNVYSLSFRATEYAFLFVLFTFAALAGAEVVLDVRMHPIQYGLVGCALAVFFLLLLALSEHIRFDLAYATAAFACVTLVTFYLRHPLGTLARAIAFLGGLASMYATLYVMLQSEESALLMGSILVFGVLATVMLATRRMDWSDLGRRMVRG